MPGVFITFEGGEGTGKSTQVRLLAEALRSGGIDIIATREPGGTPLAEKVRNLLVQRDGGNWDPVSEVLLLFAGRREHLVTKIWPALKSGQWIVSDRFADSTRAMQGCGHGVTQTAIEEIYKIVMGGFKPDLTFIFDLNPETGLQRSNKHLETSANTTEKTEDRYERMGLDFHQRLLKGFLDIAKANPDRCVVIDATLDQATIHRQILKVVSDRFSVKLKEVANG